MEKIISFRIPDGGPAITACFTENGCFAAADGSKDRICFFDGDGRYVSELGTPRSYRALRRLPSGGYLALSGDARLRRVYLLRNDFTEIGALTLRLCGEAAAGREWNDACPGFSGADPVLLCPFGDSLLRFDYGGNPLGEQFRTERGEILHATDSGTVRALHLRRGDAEYLKISELGADFLGELPKRLRLRDLLPCGLHDLYGLFSYRYFYSFLIPLYKGGVFWIPDGENMADIFRKILFSS